MKKPCDAKLIGRKMNYPPAKDQWVLCDELEIENYIHSSKFAIKQSIPQTDMHGIPFEPDQPMYCKSKNAMHQVWLNLDLEEDDLTREHIRTLYGEWLWFEAENIINEVGGSLSYTLPNLPANILARCFVNALMDRSPHYSVFDN